MMDPSSLSTPLVLTLRLSFALLLGAAAVHKLRDLARFRATLVEYDVLPPAVAPRAALAIVTVEAALASMLVAGVAVAPAAVATSALLLAYAAAISANVARGRTDLDCGCMGPAARVPVSATLVMRNVALAAAAAVMLVPASTRSVHWIDVASAVAATIALSATWLASERMLALAPRAATLRAGSRRARDARPSPERHAASERHSSAGGRVSSGGRP